MKLARISLAVILSLLLIGLICPLVNADEDNGSVDLSATTPLTISDVSASSIGYHGAAISWNTNGDASSRVFYDIESRASPEDYADSTTEETTPVNEHSVSLTGLSPSTTYHYMVKSATPDKKFIAISEDYTFRTLTPGGGGGGFGAPDTTPPRISDVSICGLTETTADICWKTKEKSTSQVEYWTSPTLLSPLDETYVIEHRVHLIDLTPGTTYHYKAMSSDKAGNLEVSAVYTFTTLGKPPAAAFVTSELSISPTECYCGEMVTICVLLTNTGNLAGSYEATLKIDDAVVASKEVTLAAGASEQVTVTTAKDMAGIYSVAVNGLSGSFTVTEMPSAPPEEAPPEVKPPINWPLIGGIIAGVVCVGLVAFFLIRRKAVQKPD